MASHLYEDGAQEGAIDKVADGLLELVLIAAHHEGHAGQQLVAFITLHLPGFVPLSSRPIGRPRSVQRRRHLRIYFSLCRKCQAGFRDSASFLA